MIRKKIICFIFFIILFIIIIICYFSNTHSKIKDEGYKINVTINAEDAPKKISPYIFGINSDSNAVIDKVKVNAIRQGGNRFSTYNWENNYSNSGIDANNISDTYLSDSSVPGDAALKLSKIAKEYNIPYKVTTLQMMGYVASDKKGVVTDSEKAPSSRWKEIKVNKESALSQTPNVSDNYVYMDEYINYLINMLGNSSSETGIQGYSLDNEPALWNKTHYLAHEERVTPKELVNKSVEVAKVIKQQDSNADVFGPALYGLPSFVNLKNESDTEENDEWNEIKKKNNYNWFIDYYLDEMKKSSDIYGTRLLNYLDLHYYCETNGIKSKILQASRNLYDENYESNNYTEKKYKNYLPLLPKIQESIDKYYPGTKIAITEYDFGKNGSTIYEGIAEVQYLSTFAKYEVGFASYFGAYSPYVYMAINMFTNCDTYGDVGDNLVHSESEDISKVGTFSATSSDDLANAKTLNIVLTNNDMNQDANVTVKVENSKVNYKKGKIYGMYDGCDDLTFIGEINAKNIKNNTFTISMPSVSAYRIILES